MRRAGRSGSARQPSLDKLARRFQTDKSSGRHDFAVLYEELLRKRRFEPVKLLEIGVYKGASLRMWAAYFPHAEIHGLDIDASARAYASDRIAVHIGDASHAEVLESIVAEVGSLDVIIDDGSHRYEDQRASLLHLWRHLAPGGLYAIEDIHTSYSKKYGMGYRKPHSTVELIKEVVDDVHATAHGHSPILEDLAAVHVHYELCVLAKRPSPLLHGPRPDPSSSLPRHRARPFGQGAPG